jgi:hypothetical protein
LRKFPSAVFSLFFRPNAVTFTVTLSE